jgi:hypothetical protein
MIRCVEFSTSTDSPQEFELALRSAMAIPGQPRLITIGRATSRKWWAIVETVDDDPRRPMQVENAGSAPIEQYEAVTVVDPGTRQKAVQAVIDLAVKQLAELVDQPSLLSAAPAVIRDVVEMLRQFQMTEERAARPQVVAMRTAVKVRPTLLQAARRVVSGAGDLGFVAEMVAKRIHEAGCWSPTFVTRVMVEELRQHRAVANLFLEDLEHAANVMVRSGSVALGPRVPMTLLQTLEGVAEHMGAILRPSSDLAVSLGRHINHAQAGGYGDQTPSPNANT